MKTKKTLFLISTFIVVFSFGQQGSIHSQNSATTDEGVIINGVKWATRNVGERPRTFVDSPENFGGFFNWNRAQNACPEGWRVPTLSEVESLVSTNSIWTNVNDINGRMFGSNENTIFFPAGGDNRTRVGGGVGMDGMIWSSAEIGYTIGRFSMFFNNTNVGIALNIDLANRNVRCVSKELTESVESQKSVTNPVLLEKGVEINGVVWATHNVNRRGTFVSNVEDFGQFFTWSDAKTACPTGWRLPNLSEFVALENSASIWTSVNGINGRRFGSGNNTIFLPSINAPFALNSSSRHTSVVETRTDAGNYWSGVEFFEDDRGRRPSFSFNNTTISLSAPLSTHWMLVRCVAE